MTRGDRAGDAPDFPTEGEVLVVGAELVGVGQPDVEDAKNEADGEHPERRMRPASFDRNDGVTDVRTWERLGLGSHREYSVYLQRCGGPQDGNVRSVTSAV